MSLLDAVLIEAMREVDAMLPDTPPIAPPKPPRRHSEDMAAIACHGMSYDHESCEFILRSGRRVADTIVDYNGWQRLYVENDR